MAATAGMKLPSFGRFEDAGVRAGIGAAAGGGANGLFVDHVYHSEAPAVEGDGLGMVREPVEDGGGQDGVVIEELRPVLEHAIGRDGTAFVSLADNLEQQVGAGFVDR